MPRSIVTIGTKAYCAGYFSDSIDVIDISPGDSGKPVAFALQTAKPVTKLRMGERYFYDASICFQGWQTCHSCHPFTRPDGLNWILNSPSTSAPKNSKSMLFSWWTPPTSWAGKRLSAGGGTGSIRAGISAELFTEPNEDVAVGLDTFFMQMKPMSSPYLIYGRLSEAAQRGKKLFNDSAKVDCINCHSSSLYTDKKFHNAQIPDPFDANKNWDTPSLIEAWRTAPYSHLGIYEKTEDMIKQPGHSKKAGSLSSGELSDLVLFILSL